jgi:excisionase family DNA binding protein
MDAVSTPVISTPYLSYSIQQASQVAGVTPWTVHTAITEGRLAARKFGKGWIILHSDLQRFLESLDPVSPSAKWLEKRKKVAGI